MTMANEKIQASCVCFQSSGSDLFTPSSWVNGILKTLKEYTCPIHRWIASASGGTSHRLYPGGSIERSRSSKEGLTFPTRDVRLTCEVFDKPLDLTEFI